MAEQKRHDSLAPKGAFVGKGAHDSELAAAQMAALISGSDVRSADDDPEITIATFDEPFPAEDDLCADQLLVAGPEKADRVSVEDAMRALIDMRLERSRPSDDFGTFSLATDHPSSTLAATTLKGDPRQMNSLAPIELAPAASRLAAQPTRKRNPFPILAAAALALLAVGIYRRADRPTTTTTVQAAQTITSTAVDARATIEAEAVDTSAMDMQVLDVTESEDAILTLGTPTILNVPAEFDEALDDSKPSAVRRTRAAKLVTEKPSAVAQAPIKPALPDAPSREAIVAGFGSVRDAVVACANGGGGVAPIEATIMNDGRITHATVGGYYQGTPEGSCIARALRTARFAPFGRESIKVTFPYTL